MRYRAFCPFDNSRSPLGRRRDGRNAGPRSNARSTIHEHECEHDGDRVGDRQPRFRYREGGRAIRNRHDNRRQGRAGTTGEVVRDLRLLLRGIERLTGGGKPYVIATLVRVDGSAYRGVGTRMLITTDGERIGTISIACLEQDVVENAQEVFASGERKLLTYDSTTEEDLLWGTGLGCSGVVQILLERMPDDDTLDFPGVLADCVFERRPALMATLFDTEGEARDGQRLILTQDDGVTSDITDQRLRQLVLCDSREEMDVLRKTNPVVVQGHTRRYDLEKTRSGILMEPLVPPVALVVFGGGDDAVPLVELAAGIGWQVTVVDHRPAFAIPERFPEAHQVIAGRAPELFDDLHVAGAAAIVMTHNYMQDLALLRMLVGGEVRYLGVLGPRARTDRLINDLNTEKITLNADMRRALHSPVGLDIGAETAEEIALSAIAEMRAVLCGREGGRLRHRKGPIHDRPE